MTDDAGNPQRLLFLFFATPLFPTAKKRSWLLYQLIQASRVASQLGGLTSLGQPQ